VNYEGEKAGTYTCFAVRASLAGVFDVLFEKIATGIATIAKPAYGIGFARPVGSGPLAYVIGAAIGALGHVPTGEEYEEDLRTCRWGDIGMVRQVYRQGYIRDVYPKNYLSDVHLTRTVDNLTLEQWIRQDASRGTLNRLSDGMVVWSLEPVAVQDVRRALRQRDCV
jgi:hypothetical protein